MREEGSLAAPPSTAPSLVWAPGVATAGPGDRAGGLLEHHMDVRPAEAERADPCPPERIRRHCPWLRGAGDAERSERRVRLVAADLGRHGPVPQDERGLDQARDARGRHGVADVRLDRRHVGRRVLAEYLAQGADLDRVAGRGRRAVRLDEADCGRVDVGVTVGTPQAGHLALEPRCHRPFSSPVVRAANAPDHGVDAVAGGDGVRSRLSTTTPTPSPRTKPSARRSNGRHAPGGDIAPMREKPTRLSGTRFR